MSYEQNINSAVKITNEAELDGSSSDNSLPPLLPPEPMRAEGRLRPLKIELKDSNAHLQQIQQVQRPPPSQMQSSAPMNRNRKAVGDSSASPSRITKKIKKGYEMARFDKVQQFKYSQCYRHKNEDGDYEPMEVCGSNSELKQFGLGMYLYFQFLKRLSIALFLMSVVVIMPMVISYEGTTLSTYTQSGSVTGIQAKLTIGNTSNNDRKNYLIFTISDILSMLILFIFWLHWRGFHKGILEDMEKDHSIVNPVRYVVTVEDFFDEMTSTKTLEMELRAYIDSMYKGAFQVEVVYNYNGNFSKFLDYDEKIEEVQKEHQVLKQTDMNTDHLVALEKELEVMEKQLLHISQSFEPMYAYIHFRTLKAKIAFLNHCKQFRLQGTWGQGCLRAICCAPNPPERQLFLNKFPVMLKNSKASRPEEINWNNVDMTGISRFFRGLCSFICVLVAIMICSGLIGLCTLYVASSSNCQSYVAPTAATTSAQIATITTDSDKYCYCNANLAQFYSNAEINIFCQDIANKVFIANSLQIGASVVSAVSNVVLAIIIALIAKYLLRPSSVPKEYSFIFWGVLLSSFFNTGVIPLLINANVFGVELYRYLEFISFINYSQLSIFSDFTSDWYALIAPYYINFMIIGCFISPLASLIVFSFKHCFKMWRIKANCDDNDPKDPLIQKEANKKVLGLEFEYAQETGKVMLLLLIGILYSGLIPLMIPLLALGMAWTYLCKRTIAIKYSVKIPADESLNETVINLIPFIILVHGFFSIWSHTADGFFASDAVLFSWNTSIFNHSIDRIFSDLMMLGQTAFILAVIVIDFTFLTLLSWLGDCCCKDQLEVPVEWAAIENQSFSDRIQKTNIHGSYKLVNHPKYGHAMKAYNELIFRKKGMEGVEETKDGLNPEFFD